MPSVFALFLAVAVALPTDAFGQAPPSPSRTVFKCEKGGKVAYSDEPCLGARRVDVEPTRGLDSSSGTRRAGADVRREKQNEQMAEAMRPIFNESPEQRATRHRRAKLTPDAQRTCQRLDSEIPKAERQERQGSEASRADAQTELLRMRTQFRQLKC